MIHLYGVGNTFALPFLQQHGQRVVVSVDAQDWAREKWGAVARNYLLLAARLAAHRADAIDDGFRQLCHHYFLYPNTSTIDGTSPVLLQAMGQGAAFLVSGFPPIARRLALAIPG